jgi:ABC-type branched-subunit amino acid transport system substrate-binding protein
MRKTVIIFTTKMVIMRSRPTRRQALKAAILTSTASIAGCVGQETQSPTDAGGDSPTTETSTGSQQLDKVVLGNATNQTGDYTDFWRVNEIGQDIAVEEVNQAGDPLGATVEVSRRDTALKPQRAKEVATQLIYSEDALTVSGFGSNQITQNLDWIREQNTPFYAGMAGTIVLSNVGGDHGTPDDISDDDWVWRTAPGDSLPQFGMAQYARSQDIQKVGTFQGPDLVESQPTETFIDVFTEQGGQVVKKITVPKDQTDYTSILGQMPWGDIDAFYTTLKLTNGIPFMRQWAQSNGKDTVGLLQAWAFNEKFIEQMGSLLEGKNLVTHTSNPTGRDPHERFEKIYKEYTDHFWSPKFSPTGYDAVNTAMLALHASGETGSIEDQRTAIEKNIRRVSNPPGEEVSTFEEGKAALDEGKEINYEGAGSKCNFSQFGNVFGPVSIMDITPDGFEELQVISQEELADATEGNY